MVFISTTSYVPNISPADTLCDSKLQTNKQTKKKLNMSFWWGDSHCSILPNHCCVSNLQLELSRFGWLIFINNTNQ